MRKICFIILCIVCCVQSGFANGKYRMEYTLRFHTKVNHMECNTRARIVVYGPDPNRLDNSNILLDKTIYTPDLNNNGEYPVSEIVTFNACPTAILIVGEHHDHRDFKPRCDYYGGEAVWFNLYAVNSCVPSNERLTGFMGTYGEGNSYFDFNVTPISPEPQEIRSERLDGSITYDIFEETRIRLTAPSGYHPGAYRWKYKVGDIEGDLPSYFQHQQTIEVCANDFISDISSALGKRITIFLDLGCGTLPTPKEFNLKLAAPGISSAEAVGITCRDRNDGEFFVEITRPLMEGESLNFELFKGDPAASTTPPPQRMPWEKINLDGTSCSFKGYFDNNSGVGVEIGPGDYYIKIFSYLNGSEQDHSLETDLTSKFCQGPFHVEDVPDFLIDKNNIQKFNPVCYGDNDGAIEVPITGGSGLYKIVCEYENGEIYQSELSPSSVRLAGLPHGVFELSVYDSKECLSDDVFIVEELEEPVSRIELFEEQKREASLDENNVEESNGMLSISMDGGVTPYQVTWKAGNAAGIELFSQEIHQRNSDFLYLSTLKNINAGTYYVEVIDAKGCKVNMIIELPRAPEIHISLNQTAIIQCQEDRTGALSVDITGGVAPFKYIWHLNGRKWMERTGMTATETLSDLGVGEYQLLITDNLGSRAWSRKITLVELTRISLSFTTEMLRCRDDSDGYLRLSVSGGNAPYTYSWSTGETGDEITGLPMGDYHVRVVDSDGCPSSATGTVRGPEPMTVEGLVTHPSCSGMSNGRIQLVVLGGTAPYSIDWGHGSNLGLLQDLSSGNYSVQVTDNHHCETISNAYELQAPEPVSISLLSVGHVSAFGGSNGKLKVQVRGGTWPYSIVAKLGVRTFYSQSYALQGDQSVIYEFNGLKAGDYIVEVKDRNYVNQGSYSSCKGELTATITEPPRLEVRAEILRQITCFEGDDGEFVAYAQGGVPFGGSMPYHYQWYQIVNGVKEPVNSTDSIFSQASNGRYQITIRDANDVEASAFIEILQPRKIEMRFETTTVICGLPNSGSITSFVSGGEGSFDYLWSCGDVTPHLTDKPRGRYTLTVTDQRGCSASADTTIISPSEVFFDHTIYDISCSGHADGSINLRIRGGQRPYTYSWSNGGDQLYVENLGAGTYTVTVTDAQLCESDTTFVIPYIPPIEVNLLTLKQPIGFGYSDGEISVDITGGYQPYKATWRNDQGTVLFEDSLSIEDGKAFSEIQNLPMGTYTLRIEDTNYPLSQSFGYTDSGCAHEFSVFLPEPPLLEVSISESHFISCHGSSDGAIVSEARGGVPFESGLPYRYTWYHNGNPVSASGAEAAGLAFGTYRLKITDANGIVAWSEILELQQPNLLQISLTASDLRCSRDQNGWAEVAVTGGTTPYSYEWTTGGAGPRIEQVPRGTYMVWVKDTRGCEQLGRIRIVQPDSIRISSQLTPPTCKGGYDGQIQVSISGGTAPYNYVWENGDNAPLHRNLPTGTYVLKVNDVNNCSYETETYLLTEPDSVKIDLGPNRELCQGQGHEAEVKVPEPAHTFKWFSPQGGLIHTGEKCTLFDPGTYIVSGTTNKGCGTTGSISITRDNRKVEGEFMVASKVPIQDDVYFVNITPSGSDSIRWILPESESFTIINEDEKTLQLVFNEYGTYVFGMRSFYAKCYETVYKTVTVMNKYEIDGYEDVDGPTLRVFKTYPNPAIERFTVEIELGKASKGTLLLIDSGNGKVLESRNLKNDKKFSETFHVSGLGTGTYLLHLIAPDVRSSLKVIVK